PRPCLFPRALHDALPIFFGWTAQALQDAADRGTEQVAESVRGWVELFRERGIAAVFEAAVYDNGLAARVLGTLNGERDLTDLRHIAEVLHQAGSWQQQIGIFALFGMLLEPRPDLLT